MVLLSVYGIWGFASDTVMTGVLGNVTSKITANTIDADSIVLTVRQHPVQLFYRQTVMGYIGKILESVFRNLRTRNTLNARQSGVF
jgi:hypothetical protein